MSKQPLMLQLKAQGFSISQIAQRLKVTEGFVRKEILHWAERPSAKPYGQKATFRRQALEMVLKRKEREAVAIASSIDSLRQEIEHMARLEATGKALYQATKRA